MAQSNREIFSVSELNSSVASMLEQEFAWVWVEGEISNMARPASGHIYFSLKDSGAQIRCAMFRGRIRTLSFDPDNGMQVLVRGKVSLYQPRGDYQLIVDRLEEAGDGILQKQFEALKEKLRKQGLFDEKNKQAIPEQPQGIAVITSASGAAIRDVLSVIERRFPSIPVHLYPVPVQGDAAALAICHALGLADADSLCDVILLVRGGGSLEDLWPFNEESVARAIHDCSTPVVSGVGHEIDFTIADFVADLRAATPSAAAEAVTPDQQAWQQTLDWYHNRLQQLMQDRLLQHRQAVQWLQKRLQQQHPLSQLVRLQQKLDHLSNKLQSEYRYSLQGKQADLEQLKNRLLAQSPAKRIEQQQHRLHLLNQNMRHRMQSTLQSRRARLAQAASTLQALSPLQTLARGYSITRDAAGRAILNTDQLEPGQVVDTRLHIGSFSSQILSISDGQDGRSDGKKSD